MSVAELRYWWGEFTEVLREDKEAQEQAAKKAERERKLRRKRA